MERGEEGERRRGRQKKREGDRMREREREGERGKEKERIGGREGEIDGKRREREGEIGGQSRDRVRGVLRDKDRCSQKYRRRLRKMNVKKADSIIKKKIGMESENRVV